jgi:hypothetical protein
MLTQCVVQIPDDRIGGIRPLRGAPPAGSGAEKTPATVQPATTIKRVIDSNVMRLQRSHGATYGPNARLRTTVGGGPEPTPLRRSVRAQAAQA